MRQISPRNLSQDERIEIADLRRAGLSMRAIADKLGRAPSTISREPARNATPAGRGYQPFDAHRRATARRARHHRRRVDTNDQLGVLVAELRGRPLGISMLLSSRQSGLGSVGFAVVGVVAQHGPDDVDTASRQGDECLFV